MKMRGAALGASALLLMLARAQAAEVKPFSEVAGSGVRLSDLFTDLAPGQDCRLGDAPAPGQRITIEEDQLAAIADQFGIDWNTSHRWRSVTLERPGRLIDEEAVLATMLPALQSAGMPTDETPTLVGWSSVELDRDTTLSARDVKFDPASGRYSAELVATSRAGERKTWNLSGAADVMIRVLATSHLISQDEVITDADVVQREVRRQDAPLSAITDPAGLAGTIARHQLPAGRLVLASDIEPPELVHRASTVLMHLDAQGLELAMQGEALDGGALGARVRVRNLTSGAVLLAVISAPNEVTVDVSSPPQPYSNRPSSSFGFGFPAP